MYHAISLHLNLYIAGRDSHGREREREDCFISVLENFYGLSVWLQEKAEIITKKESDNNLYVKEKICFI